MKPIERIWDIVIERTGVNHHSIHGPGHWARVERNGLYLAQHIKADEVVVSLFAVFHDCMRINDGLDPGHGWRGAEYARSIRDELDFLSKAQFEKLTYACEWHTDKIHTDDLTIGACWDADRLDLGRVGIRPRAALLNTRPAKEIARQGRFEILESTKIRKI